MNKRIKLLNNLFKSIYRNPFSLFNRKRLLRLKSILIERLSCYSSYEHPDKPCIFFDMSKVCLYDKGTGIQRVVKSIFFALKAIEEQRNFVVVPVFATFFSKGYSLLQCETIGNNLKFTNLRKYIEPRVGDVFLSFENEFNSQASLRKVFLSYKKNGCRIILGVHDILPITIPTCWPPGYTESFQNWLMSSLDYADFICVSKYTQQQLDEWIKKHTNKQVMTTHFCLGSNFSKICLDLKNFESSLKKLIPEGLTFLMVGTLEPRKKHLFVIKAFEHLWKLKIAVNLIIVGKKGWMIDELTKYIANHSQKNRRLFYFDKVSDTDLTYFYMTSDALIAASLDEGFGLPLIEAASFNLPIIARDIPVFREVAKNSAFYFQSDSSEGFSREVLHWINLKKSDSIPKSNNLEYLTWSQSCEELLKKLKLSNL